MVCICVMFSKSKRLLEIADKLGKGQKDDGEDESK